MWGGGGGEEGGKGGGDRENKTHLSLDEVELRSTRVQGGVEIPEVGELRPKDVRDVRLK